MAVQLRAPEPAGTPPRGLASGADTASRRAGEQPSLHAQASDAELARMARGGDGDAFAELARRYRPMMHRMAMAFFAPGEDLDDLLQAALIGLHAAAVTHREDAGPFPPHAQMCLVSVLGWSAAASLLGQLGLGGGGALIGLVAGLSAACVLYGLGILVQVAAARAGVGA